MIVKNRFLSLLLVTLLPSLVFSQAEQPGSAGAEDTFSEEATEDSFGSASDSIQRKLEASLEELNQLREQAAAQNIPLSSRLSALETVLLDVRQEFQQTDRLLHTRTLDLSNLRAEIKSRQQEASYLSNLLTEYSRNFESRLHIAEVHRYEEALDAATLAAENSTLSQDQIYDAQVALLETSLDRLHEALGGTTFLGTAVDERGMVETGTFALVGPAALFRSLEGSVVGTAEQRLGSLEPTVIAFRQPEDSLAAARLITTGEGYFPLDPTLGNAHKIEDTKETLLEHIQKGGPVMVPIFALAGTALLVALLKWLSMAFVRNPSTKRVRRLLATVASMDGEAIRRAGQDIAKPKPDYVMDWVHGAVLGAGSGAVLHWILQREFASSFAAYTEFPNSLWVYIGVLGGLGGLSEFLMRRLFGYTPVGRMLAVGVEHLNEPRELIEEVMYERVLETRLQLQRLLPFIAISAASAPLLGLLGTVTGIINTFKLITVFGSGDVKTLSGGISEALITTEFGLIVAIPSLLIHAFLSRRARSVVDQMEKAGVSLMNQISKIPSRTTRYVKVDAVAAPRDFERPLSGSREKVVRAAGEREKKPVKEPAAPPEAGEPVPS